MNTIEAILERRSIRKFEEYEMPDKDLIKILECAMSSPSACNTRPWNFVMLQTKEAKLKMKKVHPYVRDIENSSVAILICADKELQKGIAEDYYPIDCAIVAENIALASLELGYGSCICGIYPRDNRSTEIKNEFKLETDPIILVVIGKSDETPLKKGYLDYSKIKIL